MIKEQHLDTFGHVNNATYLVILEEARWDLITARGYGLKTIQKTGLGPVILEYNMKFIKELRLRQTITIETELQSYDGKIGVLNQDIHNDKQELCFQGKMTFGLFDTRERKLVLPTPEWEHAVGLVKE
jgi:YbgC/YbaW family acyl-CoA thioester hydrolase